MALLHLLKPFHSLVLLLATTLPITLTAGIPPPTLPKSPNARPLLPNLPASLSPQNITTLQSLTTPLTRHPPQCWIRVPSPRPFVLPIPHPSDCYEAILLVVEGADPDQPITWVGGTPRFWIYESCGIYLEPVDTRSLVVRDTFTRGEITRQALAILLTCVNEEGRWLGGKGLVGRGVFEVWVMRAAEGGGTRGRGRGWGWQGRVEGR